MPTRLDIDFQAMLAHGLRSNRANAGDLHPFRPWQSESEKIFHGRGAGESNQIRAFLQETAARASNVARLGYRAISETFVHNCSQRRELLGEHVPRLLRAGEQNSQILHPALLLKFPNNRFRHELLRLQIDVDMKVLHPLGGRRTDGRNTCRRRSRGRRRRA